MIEELRAELRLEPLGDFRVLQKREIQIEKTRPDERIPSGVAQRAGGFKREARDR